jgi:5-methylcytosine-specific restriction protein A
MAREMRTIPEWIAKHDDQAIPLLVRLRVFEAFGGICQGPCHRKLTPRDKHIHFDHKIPLADGGEHRESNLQPMCDWCHGTKTGQEATARAKTRAIKAKSLGMKKKPSRLSEQWAWFKRIRAERMEGEST